MRSLLIMLLAPALATAAEQPQDFAFAVPVDVDGSEALYEVPIPASVYQGVTRPDLGDLRVFNGDSEPVPFAIEPRPRRDTQTPQPIAVRYFPLYGEQHADLDGLRLKVEKSSAGTVVSVKAEASQARAQRRLIGYLIDASTIDQSYEALELDWRQSSPSFATGVRLETSNDLKTWTTVSSQAPLMRVQHDGQRLEQRSVDFQPRAAKYLRLSWPSAIGAGSDPTEPLEVTHAAVRLGDVTLEPEHSWKDVLPEKGEKPGEYLYDLGGRFPVERIRFVLSQPNTISRVEILSRSDPRHDWRPVTGGVIYRLIQQGHDVSNPDLPVSANTDRYWLLRADLKGGGLGSGLPLLSAGWIPQKLVFAARGKGPFQIAYGSSKMQPAAYPIETIVPGWRNDQPQKLAHAQPLPERLLSGPAALQRSVNYRVFALWGALALGVLLLGWMAWRLARQMQSSPAPEAGALQKAD